MNLFLRFSGISGLVILLFGFLGGLITSFQSGLMLGHLILGAALILLWIATMGVRKAGETGQLLRGRKTRFAANATVYGLVFLGLITVINYLTVRHDKRWDLTEEKLYSLDDQSAGVIKALKKPLRIVSFASKGGKDYEVVKELGELYRQTNKEKVTTEIIDPRGRPDLVDRYGMQQGNLIYLEYGEGESKGVSRTSEASEQAVTNAVIKLTRGDAKKIYYVQGHDEPDVTSQQPDGMKALSDAMANEHLTVEGLSLASKGNVPDDAAAIILADPRRPLIESEKAAIFKYADAGGRILIFARPPLDPAKAEEIDPAREIAAHFGIEVGRNIVLDQLLRLFQGPSLGTEFVINTFGAHPITERFNKSTEIVFNLASSVRAIGKVDSAVSYTDLLKTGAAAWAETDLKGLLNESNPSAKLDEGIDVVGPVTVGLAYEKKLTPDSSKAAPIVDKSTRVVVFGSVDFITNQSFAYRSNRDLVLNALNWLSGEEGAISVRTKEMKSSRLQLSPDVAATVFTSGFVLPEIFLVFGLLIWWRRKVVV